MKMWGEGIKAQIYTVSKVSFANYNLVYNGNFHKIIKISNNGEYVRSLGFTCPKVNIL